MLLSLEELEKCQSGSSNDPWDDLERLDAHLDDHLMSVSSVQFVGPILGGFAIFRARDECETPLFVLVSSEGEVNLGRVDRLQEGVSERLADFDPLQHGVVSVSVTDRHRFAGKRSDLWIVVRRISATEDQTVAYHGVVGLEEDRLIFEPALDDRTPTNEKRWEAVDAARLPEWLRAWNFMTAAGADPFDAPYLYLLGGVQKLEESVPGDIEVVACSPTAFAIGAGDEVQLWWASGPSSPLSFSTGDWVRALALSGAPNVHRGVVGPDARLLVGFEADSRGLYEAWRQPVPEFPAAVAFLPPHEESPWPDLLAAFSNGELRRLRYIGSDSFRAASEEVWTRIGAVSAASRIEVATASTTRNEGQRSAAIRGAVLKVLEEAAAVSPKVRETWLTRIADLFRPEERSSVLMGAVRLLLSSLRDLVLDQRPSWPLAEGGSDDFVAALLHTIYNRKSYIAIQDEIDQTLRMLRPAESQIRADSALAELDRRSKHNREAVWEEGEPEDDETRIRQTVFGLERWASAYLHADIARLPRWGETATVTGLAGLPREGASQIPWLVVGQGRQLQVMGFGKFGTLETPAVTTWDLSPDAVRTILHLPATHCLLVACASGTLYLLKVDPGTGAISQVDKLGVHGFGSPWAMAACTPPDGVPRIVLSFNDRQRSRLVMLAVRNGHLQKTEWRRVDLPRVRALDLAEDGEGGFLLALSSVHAAPILICRFDEAGHYESRPFRALQSGTLAVRFSSSSRPSFLVAGERRGLLWCADLREESEVSDLRWTYDLGAAVRALEVVESEGEPAFLAGAEQGRLVLLRARDGRRLWKHRLRAPVRGIRQIYRDTVAVSLQGGTVVALDRVENRPAVLKKVERYLTELSNSASEPLKAAYAEPVLALSRLIEGHSLVSILRDVPVREIRARLVRYLAEVIGPDLLEDEIGDVLQELSLREVQLLLSYLPDEVTAWDEAILRDLKRREPGSGAGDGSKRAGMAAWATLIQRLGRGSPSLEALRHACPPAEYCDLHWVRFEFAHLLLGQAAADTKSTRKRGRLLGKALELLLEMPFALLTACPAVLRYGSRDSKDFSSLRTAAFDLLNQEPSRLQDIENLANAMAFGSLAEGLLPLIAAIARLFAVWPRYLEKENSWDELRADVLAEIRRIYGMLQGLKGIGVPLGSLVEKLRPLLVSDLPPQDDEPLARRAVWLNQARQRLEKENPPGLNEKDDPWLWIAYELTKNARQAVLSAVTREIVFVNELVRPFLELKNIEIGEGHRLEMRLTARPEGGRTLADVTILFDVKGEEGLRPPGDLEDRLDILRYPDRAATKELAFRGYVRPEQRSVVVRVQMEAGGGHRYEERWPFAVPRGLDRVRYRLSFPEQLAQSFQAFTQAVAEAKSPVVFAVIDEDLGRDALISRWVKQTSGRRVNLDEAVGEIGPGRRYAARSLDLELLITSLAGPEGSEDVPDAASRPLLVTPISELLQRLLDGEVEGLLEAWLAFLESRISAERSPQWVLAIPADQACRLRALHEGRIPEVAAHRTLLAQLGPDRRRPTSLLDEACAMVVREMHVTEEVALGRLQALGWDLRLVLRWLRWSRDAPDRDTATPNAFLAHPSTRRLLDLELAALGPLELVRALVGAEIVTILNRAQVQPGHHAAEDYRSTTRKSTPKLLQGRGTPFDEKSLSSLQADLAPPILVRIEGIGLAGTQDRGRTALGQLANHGGREEKEATLRRLAERGIGSYAPPVFRTGAPYRELIRGLYDLKFNLPEAKRDGAVYAAIKGSGRSPLESLSISAIGSLSRDDLKSLLPDASGDELRKLRRICQLWGPQGAKEDGEDVEGVLKGLFQGDPLVRLSFDPGDPSWRDLLARLPWPVFGVGKELEELYIWSGRDSPVDLASVGTAAEQAGRLRQKEETVKESAAASTGGEASTRFRDLKVTVLGPGADLLAYDQTRRVAILRAADLSQAAWEGNLAEGIRRRTHSQMRITALSPFKTSGALPPRSPLFVGRERELAFIKNRVRDASILVIGSRRVGKTSLLNQIDGWAQEEPDLSPIFVDLQGCLTETDFMARLLVAVRERGYRVEGDFSIDSLSEQIRKSGRLPILLLNEIDGLVHEAPQFVSSWRGYNDRARARFVMVGYTAIGTLGNADAALFHFTEGTALAGKALVLTALSKEAGEKLLDLLESQDLGIRWATPEDRAQAYRFCLDRSYQIPWVLQRYGQLLVEHLEEERRDTLSYAAVERVIEHEGRVVWQYINGIEYQRLGGGVTNAQRPGFQLILTSVARRRYFLGGREAPIRDPGLPGRESLDLGFTVGEAQEIVKETLRELLIQRREREVVESWFDGLDLGKAFLLLTLTLMLEPDPERDGRFGFLLHILPRELQRSYGKVDPTLDELIIQQAVEFMTFMQLQPGE
jgi:hypothetical protein